MAPSHPARRAALPSTRIQAGGRPQPPVWLQGRCFHCLYKGRPGYRASECRDPIKCRRCFRSGHRARFCKHELEPPPSPTTATPAPRAHRYVWAAPRQEAAVPPAPPARREEIPARRVLELAMPRNEDTKLAEDFVVIHSSPVMTADAALLLTNAAYAWFDRPPSRDAMGAMVRALSTKANTLPADFTVTEHYPEPYLVRFTYPHHRDIVVAQHDFPFGSLRVQVRPWRLEDNAEQVDLQHHVRLCVENVSLYAWGDDVAVQQAIGSACSLDYMEGPCKRKEYTKVLCVWAWVAKPSLVPRVRWATLPRPNAPPSVRERGRRGLQRRCIVHLDLAEDHSGPVDDLTPPPATYTWRYGVVDGDRTARDRTERIQQDAAPRRRDDDQDRDRRDDRERRGRNSSRGWGDAIRRSLSRSTRNRGRDDDRRERDRSGNRGGEWRHATTALQLAVAELPVSGPRGRPWARSASPAGLRRRYRAALSLPVSPDPVSPRSVCPSPPWTGQPQFLLTSGGGAPPRITFTERSVHSSDTRRLLDIFAPLSLLRTPSRPPGFDQSPVLQPASPTTPSNDAFPVASDAVRTPPASDDESSTGSGPEVLGSLFSKVPAPLLRLPMSTPLRKPAGRRKTMVGVDIAPCSVGFSLRRASARAKAKQKAKPVAAAAELAVCKGLGIVQDGELVTERAMAAFAHCFDGEVSDRALLKLRVMFKVNTPEDDAVDEALLSHGGAAGLDHEVLEESAATAAN